MGTKSKPSADYFAPTGTAAVVCAGLRLPYQAPPPVKFLTADGTDQLNLARHVDAVVVAVQTQSCFPGARKRFTTPGTQFDGDIPGLCQSRGQAFLF